ncbi:MAG: S9 family peptidase [Candidatus Eisenbacteria bacterium]|nr:S9 family peptidase [Candidatus Eisenbacteria bacterium]
MPKRALTLAFGLALARGRTGEPPVFRPFVIVSFMMTILLGALFAPSAAQQRTHDITVDDYFTQAFISGCEVAPDGEHVAIVEQRWDLDADTRHTDIWIVNAKTQAIRRVTFDPGNDDNPQWSPDSRWLYFTTACGQAEDPPPCNGKTQVWKVSLDGQEPVPVTRFKDGVEAYALSRDGRTLYFTKSSEEVEDPWKEMKEEYKDLEYGKGVMNYSELWALDLVTWRTEKLIDENRVIGEFAVSPNGKRIAMVTTPTEELITNEGLSRIDVWDRDTRATTAIPDRLWREEAPSPYGWLGGLAWSADASMLAFHVDFDGYPTEFLVAHFGDGEVFTQRLARENEFSLGGSGRLQWIGASHDLCLMAEEKARVRVACIRKVRRGGQGRFDILTPGDWVAKNFHLSPDGSLLAAVLGDVTQPNDIFVTSTSGKPNLRRITRVNPQVDTWKLPQIEIVKWVGAKGDTVEGILELPHDYQPGTALPLHVALHGGPTAADTYYFEYWIYGRGLWPSLGWAVFAPNYRGSTGYGDEFLTDLIGAECEIEVEDVLKGVDMLIERGIADPEKMAVSGWSNGGLVTNCIITHTDRFKAASSGAGTLDMALQWGIEDTPGHVINYMQGLPWEKPEEYLKASPLWSLDEVKTPTLIHVGGNDPRVPPPHSKALFRGLDFYLGIPSELVVYPGQGHGLVEYAYRKAKLEWDIAWFDHYVLGKPLKEPADENRKEPAEE